MSWYLSLKYVCLNWLTPTFLLPNNLLSLWFNLTLLSLLLLESNNKYSVGFTLIHFLSIFNNASGISTIKEKIYIKKHPSKAPNNKQQNNNHFTDV